MRNIKEFLGGMGIDPPMTVEKMLVEHMNCLVLPSASKTDPQYIQLPQVKESSALEKYSGTKSLLWSVAHTDIDADADQWAPVFWYDTVDSAIWALVLDFDTTPDTHTLGKIDWTTGSVTVIGSCQVDFINSDNTTSARVHVYRTSMGSGDLVVIFDGEEIHISTTNGSLVSGPTMLTNGGIDLDTLPYNCYITEDGLLALGSDGTIFVDYDQGMYLMRNGGIGGVVHNLCKVYGNYTCPILWGNCVAAVGGWNSGITGNSITGPRFWDRQDFDRWLNELADSIGLPKS